MAWRILLFVSFNLISFLIKAQNTFQEGSIVYNVRIGGAAGGSQENAGTYILTVKGPNIRKELKMHSGFSNVVLQNRNTQAVYTLQTSGGVPYAVQLNMEDQKERQKPYEDFKMKEEESVMTIAGQSCHKAVVTYKDGNQATVCYAADWISPDALLFDRYPGIRNIPLSFEFLNEKGVSMYFTAEKIEPRPIESSMFRIPPDYKIISNAEYKSLRK